jgi:hypothetical protein
MPTSKELQDFQARQERMEKLAAFERQKAREILEEARKPIWVKKEEYGDYKPEDAQGWE